MEKYFYKTEGNIIYPDKTILTWGPFYYRSEEKAKSRMDEVLTDITAWCNLKDPSLNISPCNLIKTKSNDQIVFDIQAWKDEKNLQKCDGIITVELVNFED